MTNGISNLEIKATHVSTNFQKLICVLALSGKLKDILRTYLYIESNCLSSKELQAKNFSKFPEKSLKRTDLISSCFTANDQSQGDISKIITTLEEWNKNFFDKDEDILQETDTEISTDNFLQGRSTVLNLIASLREKSPKKVVIFVVEDVAKKLQGVAEGVILNNEIKVRSLVVAPWNLGVKHFAKYEGIHERVGTAVMECIVRYCLRNAYSSIFLVPSPNAVPFYYNLGFERMPEYQLFLQLTQQNFIPFLKDHGGRAMDKGEIVSD